jgi:hypothetical protein
MINAREAADLLVKTHPHLTVETCALYDKETYLFEAVESKEDVDYADPFYLVNRNNGSIRQISPLENLQKFMTAMRENKIRLKPEVTSNATE